MSKRTVTLTLPDGTEKVLPTSKLPLDEMEGFDSLYEYELEIGFDPSQVTPESDSRMKELRDRLTTVGVKLVWVESQ